MSVFPDFLYRLTPRDQQIIPIELVQQKLTINDTAVDVQTPAYVVPLGRMLILTAVTLQCTPGATAVPNWLQFAMFNRGDTVTNKFVIIGRDFEARVPNTGQITYGGEFTNPMIPEGSSLVGIGNFTNAVAANDMQVFFMGYLIPRGEIAV